MQADRQQAVERWLHYARLDLAAAELWPDVAQLPLTVVCFHAQQAAEKYIKALLVACDSDPPHTHDLVALVELLPSDLQSSLLECDLEALSFWAVEARYPTSFPEPTDEDASRVIPLARAVRDRVLAILAAIDDEPEDR